MPYLSYHRFVNELLRGEGICDQDAVSKYLAFIALSFQIAPCVFLRAFRFGELNVPLEREITSNMVRYSDHAMSNA